MFRPSRSKRLCNKKIVQWVKLASSIFKTAQFQKYDQLFIVSRFMTVTSQNPIESFIYIYIFKKNNLADDEEVSCIIQDFVDKSKATYFSPWRRGILGACTFCLNYRGRTASNRETNSNSNLILRRTTNASSNRFPTQSPHLTSQPHSRHIAEAKCCEKYQIKPIKNLPLNLRWFILWNNCWVKQLKDSFN